MATVALIHDIVLDCPLQCMSTHSATALGSILTVNVIALGILLVSCVYATVLATRRCVENQRRSLKDRYEEPLNRRTHPEHMNLIPKYERV
jgi:hypothetical protein